MNKLKALEKYDRDMKIIKMYKEGQKIADIKKELKVCAKTIYEALALHGVQTSRSKIALSNGFDPTEDAKLATAITRADVESLRKRTKVGDVIMIKTLKAASGAGTKAMIYGATRKGVVVDTGSKRFCVVRLENGFLESILWSSMIIANRTGKRVVF